MFLTVPGYEYHQSSDDRVPPRLRTQEMPAGRARRVSDSDDDDLNANRRHRSLSPYRGMSHAAAAGPAQCEFPPLQRDVEMSLPTKRSKRLMVQSVDGPAQSGTSPSRPAYSKQTSVSPKRDGGVAVQAKRRSGSWGQLRADDRSHSSDSLCSLVKPILIVDRCHDCSDENARTFVSGMALRRGGGPVIGGRTSCSMEVLLEMEAEDVAEAAGSKNVRFAPVVRVCDPESAITFRHLRHQSASSAPASLGGGKGGSCSLPTLSSGGCVGGGSQPAVDRDDDEIDLPAVVERYIRCRRQRQCLDTMDLPPSDDVHRFPPLRHRRTC